MLPNKKGSIKVPNRYGPTDHIYNKKVLQGHYQQNQHNKDGQSSRKCSTEFPDKLRKGG